MRRCLPLLATGCIASLPELTEAPSSPLGAGETRTAELRALRLDVERFEQVITLEQLRAMPPSVLDEVWLLDAPLFPVVQGALDQLAGLTYREALQLPAPTRNLRTLLRTTPDNAVLQGTSMEALIATSAALAIPPAVQLGRILDIDPTAEVVPIPIAAQVLVDQLVATHPATATRPGPVDADHPDGRWPVAPGSMPVTLGDLVRGFADLSERLGPVDTPWGLHPGIASGPTDIAAITDDFRMVALVDANALPWRGLDLTDVSDASINSLPSQIDSLFATDQPDWLRLEGVVPEPSVVEMTVVVPEDPAFHAPSRTREPLPRGAGTVWELPPWAIERVLAEGAYRQYAGLPDRCTSEDLATGTLAFEACVDATGWVSFTTFDDLGDPPPPAYLWDLVVELGQVRLHDGIPEGEASVGVTIRDVPLGLSADEVAAEAAAELAAHPEVLTEVTGLLTANGVGAPDLAYVRGPEDPDDPVHGDWLYFVHPADLPPGPDGEPVRPYAYETPGFFADEALTDRVSAPTEVHGDAVHDKVRVAVGDRLYVQDDAGVRYALDVVGKPSPQRLRLDVTRID